MSISRYGDTTPRSLQARVYGLVWIVIGITILSVFTATVTTVLTQQSIGSAKTLHGISVGFFYPQDCLTRFCISWWWILWYVVGGWYYPVASWNSTYPYPQKLTVDRKNEGHTQRRP